MIERRVNELEKEVALQGQTVDNFISSLSEVTSALKENSQGQSRLISKFDVHEALEAVRQKDFNELTNKCNETSMKLNVYINDNHDTLKRVKDKNNAIDRFKNSMLTNWGKITSMVILIAMAYALGLDLSNIKIG